MHHRFRTPGPKTAPANLGYVSVTLNDKEIARTELGPHELSGSGAELLDLTQVKSAAIDIRHAEVIHHLRVLGTRPTQLQPSTDLSHIAQLDPCSPVHGGSLDIEVDPRQFIMRRQHRFATQLMGRCQVQDGRDPALLVDGWEWDDCVCHRSLTEMEDPDSTRH